MTPLYTYIKELNALNAEGRLRQKTIIHPYRIRVNNQMFEFDGYLQEDNIYFECKYIHNEASFERILITTWRLKNVLKFIDANHNKKSKLCIIIIAPNHLIHVADKYCFNHLNPIEQVEYKVVKDDMT